MTTRAIGETMVTRVEEMCGLGFEPAFLFPDWDPAVLEKHRNWLVPACYSPEHGRFIASVHTWVLRTRRYTILVDSCTGNGKSRPQFARFHMLDTPFLNRLHLVGVEPEQVDYVLCTHLHVDHCGWNTRLENGRWVPTFPNARYIFSKAELEAVVSGGGFNAGVYEDSVLPVIEARQHMLVEGEHEFGEGLRIEPAPGHTPGHVILHLRSKGESAIFTGDVMHQPVQVCRPEWNSCFCALPHEARSTRRRILECAAEARAIVFPAHFAGSFAGQIARRADGFEWSFLQD